MIGHPLQPPQPPAQIPKLAPPHLLDQTGKGQGQLAQRPRDDLLCAIGSQIAINGCDRLCIQPHVFLRPQGRYIA